MPGAPGGHTVAVAAGMDGWKVRVRWDWCPLLTDLTAGSHAHNCTRSYHEALYSDSTGTVRESLDSAAQRNASYLVLQADIYISGRKPRL